MAEAARRLGLGLWVPVQGDEPPLGAEPLQDPAAVAAAPEGAVQVDPVGTHRQGLDRLLQQHRAVGRGWLPAHRDRLSSTALGSAVSSSSLNHSSRLLTQVSSSQSSNLLP